jgi:pyruvate formate lyase activating enzyme
MEGREDSPRVSDLWPERRCEFQQPSVGGRVQCMVCPHHCRIADGATGICLCRKNIGGTLQPLNYAHVTSAAMDPIEKKPLYHVHPGRSILSLGTWGCNFKCDFCQNWQISQQRADTQLLPPHEAVALARRQRSVGIAYTYNEPTVWFEYVLDTARLARQAGLINVLVTNGYIDPEPLEKLLDVVDAMNIDVKSFTEAFYRRHCRARLAPVLETARRAARRCHVETTTLLIPGENDSPDEIEQLGDWIAENLGPESPTHVSAYFPRYRLDAPPTPPATLERAWTILKTRLKFVYMGNIVTDAGSHTVCPDCGAVAVRRSGYRIDASGLREGACARCGRKLNMVC